MRSLIVLMLSDQKVEADREVVIRAATRQSRKRKPNQVDSDGSNSDKENISLSPPAPGPVAKRICREKTGTEWETVLDVVKFGEEQRSKQNEAVVEKRKP